MRALSCLLLLFCLCLPVRAEAATPTFVPPKAGAGQADMLKAFLDLPYREDGTLDERGRWTLFADPTASFTTPGFNCSGFVLSASRYLLGRNLSPTQAMRDRANDSGPGAAMGQDWDFGWDLICNISEGFTRTLFLPGGGKADPATYDGRFRGYALNSDDTWKELLPRLKTGAVYLLSFSKETRRAGYTLLHYHVGIIVKTPKGEVLFFQTSSDGGKVNCRDLATAKDMASLHRDFADKPGSKKMIAVIEVLPSK